MQMKLTNIKTTKEAKKQKKKEQKQKDKELKKQVKEVYKNKVKELKKQKDKDNKDIIKKEIKKLKDKKINMSPKAFLYDVSKKAKPRGRRVSKSGKVYYEYRINRTDGYISDRV